MNFQKTTIMVGSIALIILLLVFAYQIYNEKYKSVYPPVVSECPDFWENNSNDNPSRCFNVKNLGSESCAKTMDFSQSSWTGSEGSCNKYKWAKECDITWDGITNNPKVCKTE